MPKKLLTLVLGLLVTACSSTKVHLNHRYLDEQQLARITQKLEEAGYNVKVNNFAYPNNISQSTLVYSPMIGDKAAVDNILQLLDAENWPVHSVSPLVSGKHWFTKDSVGLYLLPEGINPHYGNTVQDLVSVYKSRACETDVEIHLKADAKFEIVFSEPVSEDRSFTGAWHSNNYPVIQLTPDDDLWPWYFEVNRTIESDKISNIEVAELVPLNQDKLFPGCKFASGVRA